MGPIRLGPTRLGPTRLGSIRRRSGQARGLLARPYRWDYRTADQWGRLWRMAAARRRHETPGPLGSTPIRGRRRGLEASPVPAARRSGQALTRGVQQARDRVRLTRLAKIQISHLFRHPPRHPRPETSFTLATRHPLVGAAPAPTGKDPSVRGQKADAHQGAGGDRSVPVAVLEAHGGERQEYGQQQTLGRGLNDWLFRARCWRHAAQ